MKTSLFTATRIHKLLTGPNSSRNISGKAGNTDIAYIANDGKQQRSKEKQLRRDPELGHVDV